MDAYIRTNFFSRQGKATKHLFNSFKGGHSRSYDLNDEVIRDPINPAKLLEKLLKERNDEAKGKEKSISPSSFFRSKGHDFSNDSSDAPGAGHYSPVFTALDSRLNQGPKYHKPSVNKRKAKIFLPSCLNNELQCKSNDTEPYGIIDRHLNRTVHTVEEYETKVSQLRSLTPIPEKPYCKVISPIQFAIQKPRDPFVKPDSGPNEKRFSYTPSKLDILQRFKRPESVDFSKMSFRVDKPSNVSAGPYNKNLEYVMPKLSKNVPDFSKQLERKALVLEHILKTPNSPDLITYNSAFTKQGNYKGPKKLPLMKTLTARDDSMYKVTEAYSLNSKRSQSPD